MRILHTVAENVWWGSPILRSRSLSSRDLSCFTSTAVWKRKKITLFWAPSRALPSWGKFSSDFHFRDFFLSCFKSTAVLGEVLKSQRPNISTLWSRYVVTFQNVCLGGCSEWQQSSLFLFFYSLILLLFRMSALGAAVSESELAISNTLATR